MAVVSIGMPVYARPEHLKLALESLLGQSFTDFELLISDDASPDPRVREVCERFAGKDNRVFYQRQPGNIGAHANHLHVLKAARSPLFMWSSEDDYYKPVFLEHGVSALAAEPQKAAWFCQTESVNRLGALYQAYPPFTRFASHGDKRRELRRFLLEPEILGKANLFHALYRREAIIGLLDIWRKLGTIWGQDNALAYAFLCRHDILVDPELLFFKRADTSKSRRYRDLPGRHIYPLGKAREYFEGLRVAATGTPYERMTRHILRLRFIRDHLYAVFAFLPGIALDAWRAAARRIATPHE